MDSDEVRGHIQALIGAADSMLSEDRPQESGEQRVKQAQVRAIKRSIRSLEKIGVPVPSVLKEEMATLERSIVEMRGGICNAEALYEEMLEVVERLGQACGHRPYRDLYLRSQERRKAQTPRDVIRKNIVDALQALGGKSHWRKVVDHVGGALDPVLTEADRDVVGRSLLRWQQAVRREGQKMRREGLLTADSRTEWKLAGAA